ncbi:MAG TPA: hypothetical protein DDY82_05395 [Clostridiales bacterium]|nr:hypothetical protein [Clostridiales bacterium]
MKRENKLILILALFLIITTFLGCKKPSATKKIYVNSAISYDLTDAEKYFKCEFFNEKGGKEENIIYRENMIISLSPVNQNDKKNFIPYLLTVDGKEYFFTYENGKYIVNISVATKSTDIFIKLLYNQVKFSTKEHSSLFDVYYQDENGNKLNVISLGQTAYLTIEKNANTLENENECVVGFIKFNNEKYYSDKPNKIIFKKQITFTKNRNEINVTTFVNSYDYDPIRAKEFYKVIITDKNGNEIGYAPEREEINITIKRSSTPFRLERFYISVVSINGEVLRQIDENQYVTSITVKFVSLGKGIKCSFKFQRDDRIIRDD